MPFQFQESAHLRQRGSVDAIGRSYFPIQRAGLWPPLSFATMIRGFGEWGDIFGDQVGATALLDRLLHHARVVQIEGSSYRLREHAALVPENLKSQVCRPACQRTAAPAWPSK